jgi:hypothetical protein
LTGVCIVILWHTTGLSWWLFGGLVVTSWVINWIPFIRRMYRSFERIRRDMWEDIAAEAEASRKREMARVRRRMRPDDRTVN